MTANVVYRIYGLSRAALPPASLPTLPNRVNCKTCSGDIRQSSKSEEGREARARIPPAVCSQSRERREECLPGREAEKHPMRYAV